MTSSVGIPRMLKRAAVEPFASTSSLPTLTRPLYSAAMESTVGASARHGAHHAAQKSTSTGVVDFTTSDSKLESVISRVFSPMKPPKKFYSSREESQKSIGDTEREFATKRHKNTQESTVALFFLRLRASACASRTADNAAICEIAGGHRPPLQCS